MANYEKINQKLNEQFAEISKRFVEIGTITTKETLNAATDVLKVLSKELSSLSEVMGKWAESTEKKANEPKKDAASAEPPKDPPPAV